MKKPITPMQWGQCVTLFQLDTLLTGYKQKTCGTVHLISHI